MATPEKLLSTKNGEKADTIDANKEDKKVQDVGGPESDWSTAQYANFKFDATLGVSPDKTILGKAKVDAEDMDSLKEGEECPVCEESPCSCVSESLTEVSDEAEDKKDLEEGEESEDESEGEGEDESEDESEDEDDTLELDLSDLVDDSEDIIELSPDEDAEETDSADVEDVADEIEDSESEGSEEVEDVEEADMDFTASDADHTWSDDEEEGPSIEMDEEGEESGEDTEDDEDEDMEEAKGESLTMGESKFKLTFNSKEMSKLFEHNTTLTEEDKRQSRALFESAVRTVAKQIGEELRTAYQTRFTQMTQQHEAKVAKQVDSYLSYVVEQWVKDNKVALQHQLRNRLAESFIDGFKKLCTEHYIDVPQSKVNVVQALAKNVKSLKSQLKESEARLVSQHTEAQDAIKRERIALRNEHKSRLIAEAASAVTAADRGSFVERANTVKFSTTKEFKKNLIALREQYFAAKKSVERPMNEPVAAPLFEEKKSASSAVDVYTRVADRFTR